MRHYRARQLKATGLWHYTCLQGSSRLVYPVGFCADGMGLQEPCAGHATAEEAVQHYHDYLLLLTSYDQRYHKVQHPCLECGTYTEGFAYYGWKQMLTLCDTHRTAEFVVKHRTLTDESWES